MSREIWIEVLDEIRLNMLNKDECLSRLDSLYTVSKKGESIEVRKSKFTNQIGSHKSEYPREMLIDFLNYWSEISINGKKMRFEKEKVFDVKLRLSRWHKNSKANEKLPNKIGRTTEDSISKFIAENSI
mgnify:FL=1